MSELDEEILALFSMTDHHPESGKCNITFQVFVQANFEQEYLEEEFPNLAKYFRARAGLRKHLKLMSNERENHDRQKCMARLFK